MTPLDDALSESVAVRDAVLSFAALMPLSGNNDGDHATDEYGTESIEPLDPFRDPAETMRAGFLRVSYGFQTRWSPPSGWAAVVAEQFPECCLVLGWVEPGMNMAGSLLLGRGAPRQYEMGPRRKERIYRRRQAEWARCDREGSITDSDDNELFADWEADWEVMDVLITRWDQTLRRRLGLPRKPSRYGRSHGAPGEVRRRR